MIGYSESIEGNVEVVGSILGIVIGNVIFGVVVCEMFGDEVFDFYVNLGIMIDLESLWVGSRYLLINVVLGLGYNFFGSFIFFGIYVVNCVGVKFEINDV